MTAPTDLYARGDGVLSLSSDGGSGIPHIAVRSSGAFPGAVWVATYCGEMLGPVVVTPQTGRPYCQVCWRLEAHYISCGPEFACGWRTP